MKLAINHVQGWDFYYYSYYDTDEGALYFEVKTNPEIMIDLSHISNIVISKKHYYSVEYAGKTADDAHLFKVIDYYNRWFERNMKQ